MDASSEAMASHWRTGRPCSTGTAPGIEEFAVVQLHLPGVGVLEFQRGEHVGVGVPDGFPAQMLGHAVLGFDGQLLQVHETFLALALAQHGLGTLAMRTTPRQSRTARPQRQLYLSPVT